MYERIYIYIERQSVTYLAFEETRKLHKNYSIIFFTHRRERRGDSLHVAT